MSEFTIDGRTLAYDVWGDPEAPPVLLIHGLSDNRATWSEVAPRLAPSYRVFAYDQRGHGGSTHTPDGYRIEHFTDDAAVFVDQVIGRPSAVVGGSLGAIVTARLAAQRPDLVTAAVLVDPPYYPGSTQTPSGSITPQMVFALMQGLTRQLQSRGATVSEFANAHTHLFVELFAPGGHGTATTLDDITPDDSEVTDPVRLAIGAALRDIDPDAFNTAVDPHAWDAFDRSRPIDVPVLLLRADPALGAIFETGHIAPFLETHPDAQIEIVPGSNHVIQAGQLELFMNHVTEFLERHRPASA
jgi:pimeloyl-ACP methyl ester carboxylesterase